MSFYSNEEVRISRDGVSSRRRFIQHISAGSVAAGSLGFRELMAVQANELRKQGRSMILLFMQGGPSQFETFDPKPGTRSGGDTKAIKTAASGIRIAENWNKTAKVMQDIAIIRSLTNREGNHRRASYQLHTGYAPAGSVKHPSLGANIAKQIADPKQDLPAVVGIGRAQSAGFLGVEYEPFLIRNASRKPENVATTVDQSRYSRRLNLLNRLQDDFASRGAKAVVESHKKLYGKASRFVLSKSAQAFDISKEPRAQREKYGNSSFGRGCLLARRLVESGVTFVEVASNGWDTHSNNMDRTNRLSAQVDPAFAALVADLKDRGLLETTLVIWMGEFGRTPRVNSRGGRDHYPRVFSAAMAGGGVKGGQVIGASNREGTRVASSPVTVPDLFCSICKAMNVNPRTENVSPLGRPMKIVDGGKVVSGLFG